MTMGPLTVCLFERQIQYSQNKSNHNKYLVEAIVTLRRATVMVSEWPFAMTIIENRVRDVGTKTAERMHVHLCAFDNNVRVCCVKCVACLHPVRCDATSYEVARADVAQMLPPHWSLLSQ